jgi:hypothetical protein
LHTHQLTFCRKQLTACRNPTRFQYASDRPWYGSPSTHPITVSTDLPARHGDLPTVHANRRAIYADLVGVRRHLSTGFPNLSVGWVDIV